MTVKSTVRETSYERVPKTGRIFSFKFSIQICPRDMWKRWYSCLFFAFFWYYFQVKKTLKFLCAIIRVSVALWEHQCMNKPDTQSSYSYEGFKFQNGNKSQSELSFLFIHTAQTGKAHNLESIHGQRFLFLFCLRIFHWFSLYLTRRRQSVLFFKLS